MNRNATIVISVIALHVAVLWAMQEGLLRRVAEAVVPAEILVEIMVPASPVTEPKLKPRLQSNAQPKSETPKPALPTPAPTVAPQPAPSPMAIASSAVAPEPGAAAPTPTAAPATTSTYTGGKVNALAAPAAPPKVELPSSSAVYLNNPKPPYPAFSKRLGEQGKVVVRAWIGIDGQASQATVKTSSGFDRLDQAALNTVLAWRYLPGKRAGVPEAMWFDVPVNWVLQ